jgi:phosphotransferase system IIA component
MVLFQQLLCGAHASHSGFKLVGVHVGLDRISLKGDGLRAPEK